MSPYKVSHLSSFYLSFLLPPHSSSSSLLFYFLAHLVCNPPLAISCFPPSLFSTLHHSFSPSPRLPPQPHISISWSCENRKREESAALTRSLQDPHLLIFSGYDMRNSAREMQPRCATHCPSSPLLSSPLLSSPLLSSPLLSCESLSSLTSLENLNLSFIVPLLAKLVFPCS